MIKLSSKEIYLTNGGFSIFGPKEPKEPKELKEQTIFSSVCVISGIEFTPADKRDKLEEEFKQCKANLDKLLKTNTTAVCTLYRYRKRGEETYGHGSIDCSKDFIE